MERLCRGGSRISEGGGGGGGGWGGSFLVPENVTGGACKKISDMFISGKKFSKFHQSLMITLNYRLSKIKLWIHTNFPRD